MASSSLAMSDEHKVYKNGCLSYFGRTAMLVNASRRRKSYGKQI